MTLNCLKCGCALASRFVMGGSYSECQRCGLIYTSVADLMQRSDRVLVQQFWEYILAAEFRPGPPCPQCQRPLSKVPLRHGGRQDPVLSCKSCYHLVLKEDTLRHFEKENPGLKRKELAQRIEMARTPDSVERFMNRVAQSGESRWVLQFGAENGQKYAFAFTLNGVLMAGGALLFLNQTGAFYHWGLLAALCSFGFGLRLSRLKDASSGAQSAELPEAPYPRELKDLGSQSRMPATRPSVRDLHSADSRFARRDRRAS